MEDLVIRECTYNDLEDVVHLQKQWATEEITHGFVPADKNYLETKLGKYFFVAESKYEIVGFIYGTIHKAENMAIIDSGQLYIEVDDVYVSLNSRGTGLGSFLLDKILEVAKENGIERSLIYSSTKDMDSIINFYKRHDYKTWCIKMFK
ncbi:N-acetyltransferase family protein [Brassicibacter mesophilus]|uniref:GNAT family N-acetyltransferase n=1 Tax=Brassicibacter mesophilus TaxID=745119 RepID=UPI003D20E7D0